MIDTSQVCAIVPAFNEARTIRETIAGIKSRGVSNILVVDDGSRDGTPKLAEEAGAFVIKLPENRGKGAAMRAGLEKAGSEVVAFLDADLGESAADVIVLLQPVLSGAADVTIARLARPTKRGGFGAAKGLARFGHPVFLFCHPHSAVQKLLRLQNQSRISQHRQESWDQDLGIFQWNKPICLSQL
jgi:glycosyltransferase involved in cell wall biosynthesis